MATSEADSAAPLDPSATADLLLRWYEGDRAALDELLSRNLGWIQERVRARLGPALRAKGETQDYVQDAVIEVLRYGPRFVTANREQFRSLLARIVENVLRDRHGHFAAGRRAAYKEQPMPSDSVVRFDLRQRSTTRPSEHAMRTERQALVRLAIELLDPDDRNVILLRQHEGLPFEQIGEALGLPGNTARMRFQRALPRLAAKVEELLHQAESI